MKVVTSIAILALVTTEVSAFPALANEHMQRVAADTQKGK